DGGRRRRVRLGRARHQPARAVAQDQVVRAGAALVPGSHHHRPRMRRQTRRAPRAPRRAPVGRSIEKGWSKAMQTSQWGAIAVAAGSPAAAQGTLRIGMTASDIPLTTGQTDNGGEGMRFMGYTVYDGLINWDLSSADKPSDLVPGLAASWSVDESDRTKWT